MAVLTCAAGDFQEGRPHVEPWMGRRRGDLCDERRVLLGGGIQGFNVDLFTKVAKQMRREITSIR